MATAIHFCHQCGVKVPEAARFCSGCGVRLEGAALDAGNAGQAPARRRSLRLAPLTPKNLMVVVAAAAAVTGAGWYVKSNLAGTKPTVTYEEVQAKNDSSRNDPELKSLRQIAEKSPSDKQGWTALGEALLTQLQASDKPSQQLIFETIETLRKVLDIDATDQFALLNMADISMNQQVFDKAVDYYSKYLKAVPGDKLARARFASALAFTGKSDDAVNELNAVLKEEPTNFPALAYLAVTYAQMGQKPKALEVGARALTSAPSEEARARFSSFLDSVKNESETPVAAPDAKTELAFAGAKETTPGLQGVEDFIRANEIAGPKFVRAAVVDGIVALYFNEFPMDKMPPFVREKFSTSVTEKVRSLVPNAVRVSFVDATSGVEMLSSPLNGR